MEKETPFQLPTYNGYTIDKRLRQFRKVSHCAHEAHGEFPGIEFIDFDSEKGQELLDEMREYFSFLYDEHSDVGIVGFGFE